MSSNSKPKEVSIEATLLIQNAKIRTLDKQDPVVESLASLGERIIAIGSNKELAGLAGPSTKKLDLEGRTVLPGFIDAHQHLSIFSQIPLQLNLSALQIKNVGKLLEAVQSEAKRLPRGEWIRGVLYDDTKMLGDRALTKEDLDRVVPYHPVIIIHVSYNWSIVNSEALRRGGISETTRDQKGRKIGRDSITGRLTGQLFGTAFHSEAMSGGRAIVPPFEKGIRERALIDAARTMNAAGITSVTDASCAPSYVTSYQGLAVDRLLPLRINMLISYFC